MVIMYSALHIKDFFYPKTILGCVSSAMVPAGPFDNVAHIKEIRVNDVFNPLTLNFKLMLLLTFFFGSCGSLTFEFLLKWFFFFKAVPLNVLINGILSH